MALIKKCACGCINDGNEALCRKCGIDILFDTPENIPDEEYEIIMGTQNGDSEEANSSQAEVPENGGATQNSSSGAGSTASKEADLKGVFDPKPQPSGGTRSSGTNGRIVVHPAPPANVSGKYLQSLDNECVIQPKPMGEKSLIGRSAADKSVSDYLFPRTGVSRNHANFWHDGNNLFIEDIGSTNGTFIDNKRIDNNKSYVLKPGNQVSFGNPKGDAAKIAIFKVK